MKKQRVSTIVGALALCGSALFPGNVFAANPGNFGIGYNSSNGILLGADGSNIIQNERLTNKLEEIIPFEGVTVTMNNSSAWKEGFIKGGESCRKVKYLQVGSEGIQNSDASFTISYSDYKMEVKIPEVGTEGFSGQDPKTASVSVVTQADPNNPNSTGFSALYGGYQIYTDAMCETKNTDIQNMTSVSTGQPDGFNGRIFTKMKIKLTRNNTPFASSNLYLGIVDVDASQSFKIMDAVDDFGKADHLFTKDKAKLQPDPESLPDRKKELRNKIVIDETNGSYIYSEYNEYGGFDTGDVSNIYAKISQATQEDGLDVVFGYAGTAASRILYYSQMHTVRYKADYPGGSITDRTEERVISGEKPLGSSQTPDSGYTFRYWTADKDVEIGDDTITQGSPISMEQIKSIVVEDDYVFTAHYKKDEPETKQYTVTYEPEEPGGQVTGISSEKVNEGENPSGSEAEADDGYTVSHWTTDQDVTLEDNTIIKAGEKISDEQIKQVIVDKDMRFVVHFKKKDTPNTPNTGAMTGGVDAATIATASVFGIVLIALAIKELPHLARKKVNFD